MILEGLFFLPGALGGERGNWGKRKCFPLFMNGLHFQIQNVTVYCFTYLYIYLFTMLSENKVMQYLFLFFAGLNDPVIMHSLIFHHIVLTCLTFSIILFLRFTKKIPFFGGYPITPSSQKPPPPPHPTHTHTHTHTHTQSMKQPFCTNPFVFTPPFPPNNVLQPNSKPSTTDLGHLLASHSVATKLHNTTLSNTPPV